MENLQFSKSSRCSATSTCVEVAFKKSSFCGSSASCVEVAFDKAEASKSNGSCVEFGKCSCNGGTVYVRDSKNPEGPVLEFTFEEWAAFLEGVDAGEFEPEL